MRKDETFQRVTISETEYGQLKRVERKIKPAKVLKRIQAFKLMYRGWNYSAIAEFLLVTNNTITDWINLYKEGGIESLLTLHYKGGQAKLSGEQLSGLRNKANKGSFAIAKDVQHYIKQNFGIEYNLLDNARYNYAKSTRGFAEENDIFLLFMPPYAPNLNIIERLWKFAKKHLVNNSYHEDFSQFFDATVRFFNTLDEHHQELTSLSTQKFQIIHAE